MLKSIFIVIYNFCIITVTFRWIAGAAICMTSYFQYNFNYTISKIAVRSRKNPILEIVLQYLNGSWLFIQKLSFILSISASFFNFSINC